MASPPDAARRRRRRGRAAARRLRGGPRPAPACRGRPRAGCPGHRRGGPSRPDAAHAAGRPRCRRRRRVRRPALRRAPVLRRAARRLHLGARGPGAQPARPPGRGEHRRRRCHGLPPGPADPRAAHPAREGDQQHLHRAGAARRRGGDVRRLPRARWPPGDRRAGARSRRRARRRPSRRRRRDPALPLLRHCHGSGPRRRRGRAGGRPRARDQPPPDRRRPRRDHHRRDHHPRPRLCCARRVRSCRRRGPRRPRLARAAFGSYARAEPRHGHLGPRLGWGRTPRGGPAGCPVRARLRACAAQRRGRDRAAGRNAGLAGGAEADERVPDAPDVPPVPQRDGADEVPAPAG